MLDSSTIVGRLAPPETVVRVFESVEARAYPTALGWQLGIVERRALEPRVRLAIEGRNTEGWYPMGPITVERGSNELVYDDPARLRELGLQALRGAWKPHEVPETWDGAAAGRIVAELARAFGA